MKILAFKPNPKNDKQGFVRFDDNTEAWTPEIAKIPDLVGKDLPDDWTLRDGPKGKQLLPPKERRGSGPAWANTEEGEKYVQERMDRRTALMQAVADVIAHPALGWQDMAEMFYIWLRKNLDVPEGPRPTAREHGSAGAESSLSSAQGPPSGTPAPSSNADALSSKADEVGTGEGIPSAILDPSTEHSPVDAPEGGQHLGEERPPSRRTCLHTKGMEQRGKYMCCIECGKALEKVG